MKLDPVVERLRASSSHVETHSDTRSESPPESSDSLLTFFDLEISAGSDRSVGHLGSIPMLAELTVNDEPELSGDVVVNWSLVAGPGVATFSDTNRLETSVSFSHFGQYTLEVSATMGASYAFDRVSVTVSDEPNSNQRPVVNAGVNRSIPRGASLDLNGSATDDGLPSPPLTILWERLSGPGSVVFSDANAARTSATFSVSGTYVLRLSANDSEYSVSDTMEVNVLDENTPNASPYVDAGVMRVTLVSKNVPLRGVAVDDGLPNNSMTYEWSKFSGPGDVTFSNSSRLLTNATFSQAGDYTLQLAANDGERSSIDHVEIVVNDTELPLLKGQGNGFRFLQARVQNPDHEFEGGWFQQFIVVGAQPTYTIDFIGPTHWGSRTDPKEDLDKVYCEAFIYTAPNTAPTPLGKTRCSQTLTLEPNKLPEGTHVLMVRKSYADKTVHLAKFVPQPSILVVDTDGNPENFTNDRPVPYTGGIQMRARADQGMAGPPEWIYPTDLDFNQYTRQADFNPGNWQPIVDPLAQKPNFHVTTPLGGTVTPRFYSAPAVQRIKGGHTVIVSSRGYNPDPERTIGTDTRDNVSIHGAKAVPNPQKNGSIFVSNHAGRLVRIDPTLESHPVTTLGGRELLPETIPYTFKDKSVPLSELAHTYTMKGNFIGNFSDLGKITALVFHQDALYLTDAKNGRVIRATNLYSDQATFEILLSGLNNPVELTLVREKLYVLDDQVIKRFELNGTPLGNFNLADYFPGQTIKSVRYIQSDYKMNGTERAQHLFVALKLEGDDATKYAASYKHYNLDLSTQQTTELYVSSSKGAPAIALPAGYLYWETHSQFFYPRQSGGATATEMQHDNGRPGFDRDAPYFPYNSGGNGGGAYGYGNFVASRNQAGQVLAYVSFHQQGITGGNLRYHIVDNSLTGRKYTYEDQLRGIDGGHTATYGTLAAFKDAANRFPMIARHGTSFWSSNIDGMRSHEITQQWKDDPVSFVNAIRTGWGTRGGQTIPELEGDILANAIFSIMTQTAAARYETADTVTHEKVVAQLREMDLYHLNTAPPTIESIQATDLGGGNVRITLSTGSKAVVGLIRYGYEETLADGYGKLPILGMQTEVSDLSTAPSWILNGLDPSSVASAKIRITLVGAHGRIVTRRFNLSALLN